MSEPNEIRVNRAPVLTPWAAVVAERLGHGPNAAITLGVPSRAPVPGPRRARSA